MLVVTNEERISTCGPGGEVEGGAIVSIVHNAAAHELPIEAGALLDRRKPCNPARREQRLAAPVPTSAAAADRVLKSSQSSSTTVPCVFLEAPMIEAGAERIRWALMSDKLAGNGEITRSRKTWLGVF